MCDTVVVTPEATADGVMIFGKNSDREPNEAQYLEYLPGARHPQASVVQCTYIGIPQVEQTYAVLLSRPFWMWGAEMGVNEHGLMIGNEAIFSRLPANRQKALLGMDLLRLGLERARTARQALTVITALLEARGQGGNGGFQHELYYHNSFLLADPQEAWVLETVERHWAAKQVRGVCTISNCLTLGNDWDLASADLVAYAVERGWCKGRDDFDFARCYSDFLYTYFSAGRQRCSRTLGQLSAQKGKISAATVMAALRDHGQASGVDGWGPDQGVTGADVCMHASLGVVRGGQSTGSLVGHLHPEHPTYFATGTAAPCTGLYKPVWMDVKLPDIGPSPEGIYNPATLFWRHERLHRATLLDYAHRIHLYCSERDDLEQRFVKQALELASESTGERSVFVAQCFSEAEAAEGRWLEKVSQAPVQKRNSMLYSLAWQGFNRKAQMPE